MADACPFCRLLAGIETERNRLDDIVWRDEWTAAFISPRWWPATEGHVLVIPNAHVSDLEAIDEGLLGAVYATVKRIAAAMRTAYGCAGTSTRQHNGAGAGQDVWHLHVHVFTAQRRRRPLRTRQGVPVGVAERTRPLRCAVAGGTSVV